MWHARASLAVILGLTLFVLVLDAATPSYEESRWFDLNYDLTMNVLVPPRLKKIDRYNVTDFQATLEGVKWCEEQGGKVSYRQYSYIGGAEVIPYGKKRAFCDLGQYTLTEVETLTSPVLTLAQMAYVHPLPNFKWDRSRWGNPATQYCYESGGASLSEMYIPELGSCTGTGWSILPAESSPGLSTSCEFADGSSIDAWALFNGQPQSRARRLNPHFRTQIEGRRCMSLPSIQ